jgi:hypothetical protein
MAAGTNGWSAEEEDFLLLWYTEAPLADLCAHLGRSDAGVRKKARQLGLRKREFWTDEEMALLTELYLQHAAEQIAARLPGRSVKSVQQKINKLGLLKRPRLPQDLVESVRRLHAEGLTDAAIARQLDSDRETIHYLRYGRLKLPPNAAAIAEAHRQAVRTQYARLGIQTVGQLRALSYRRYAAENSWPEDLRPRAVQILNLLAAAGVPLSRRQIADGIGMPWKGSRKSLTSNDQEGSYLAHLAARGLVRVLPRALTVVGQGRGHSCHLYVLGSAALAILQERAKSCPASTTV